MPTPQPTPPYDTNIEGSENGDSYNGTPGRNRYAGNGGGDFLRGGDGNDVLLGGEGSDFLQGQNGDDYLEGGAGDDNLRGGNGDDTVLGGDGNDQMRGGAGIDILDGGAGDDRISFYDFDATQGVIADLATQIMSNDGYGNSESLVSIEGLGADTRFVDTFLGSDGVNFLGASSDDILYGRGGDDTLQIGASLAGGGIVDGGSGIDALVNTSGFLTDSNGDGIAELQETDRGISVNLGLAANQLVDDGRGNTATIINVENLFGTRFSDRLVGNDVANVISSSDGDDQLFGDGGNDVLNGGGGNDELDGGTGVDAMTGGTGNDIYIVDDAGDTVTEAADEGIDRVKTSLSSYTLPDAVEILGYTGTGNFAVTGNALDNAIIGGTGDDSLIGGSGNDTLDGATGADTMNGGDGEDRIFVDDAGDVVTGDTGSDRVKTNLSSYTLPDDVEILGYTGTGNFAGTGNALDNVISGGGGGDVITGGAGRDSLFGGGGADRFVFASGDAPATGESDQIFDFSVAQGDKIDVAAIDAITGGTDNAFSFIGTAAFGNVPGQLRSELISGSTYVMGDVDGDGVADFIIILYGDVPLTAGDFLL